MSSVDGLCIVSTLVTVTTVSTVDNSCWLGAKGQVRSYEDKSNAHDNILITIKKVNTKGFTSQAHKLGWKLARDFSQ